MHKFLRTYVFVTSILALIFATGILTAQVTYSQPDETNLGINQVVGMMGFAWGDYDGDGDLDLFQPGSGNPSILYMNDVLGDSGKFVDVSAQGVLVDEVGSYAQGAIWLDYDNDGNLDLLSVDGGLQLYKNDGATFTHVSVQTGLSAVDDAVQLWMVTAGDFDRDGDLDLALAGADQGAGGTALPTRLLKNDDGLFTDVADAIIGFELILESWNPTWVDVNNDGYLDLWMPTLRTAAEGCALLFNRNGTELEFMPQDVTALEAKSAIQSSWADYDNDGDMDLFLTPYSGDADGVSKFFLNNGGTFVDIATDLALDQAWTDCRGTDWGDFDNDGDVDLLVGHNGELQQLFRNDGGSFVEVGADIGVDSDVNFRSLMFLDYDNDGFLDIFFSSSDGKLLLHNGGNANHWIGIKPQGNGTTNNTAAIGARVRVVSGDLVQIRDIQAGSTGGMTNGNMWAHFGLGEATTVDSVIIRWPNGLVSEVTGLAVDQYHTLSQTALDLPDVQTAVARNFALHQNYPNPFNPVTTIAFTIPVRSDVRIELVNTLGETIKIIASGSYAAGVHAVNFDGSDLASGLYFYKLQAGSFVDVKKLVLLK
jgi:hypothetical protein